LKIESTNRLRYKESPHYRLKEYNRGRSPRSRGQFRDWSQEIKSPRREHMVALADLDLWLNEARIEPGKDLRPLPLHDEEHVKHIGTSLNSTDYKLVSQRLIDHAKFFAWTALDMPGVSLNVITHSASVYKEARPIA